DNIAPDQMKDYMAIRSRNVPEQHLLMDSTDHENYHLDLVPITVENDHDSNDEALARMLPSYIGPALDFYDRYLLGRDSVGMAPVRWHHGWVGWRPANDWPPPGSREERVGLRGGWCGGAASADGACAPGQVSCSQVDA